MRVAQPEGFGPGAALAFGEIVLDLDVASLAAGDPYVLELVRVADPVVYYVLREDRTSNLDVIQRSLAGADDAPAEADDSLRLRIDRLEVEGGRILADVKTAGIGEHEANLPAVRLDRLGSARGLPPGELAARIGQRFVTHSLASATASSVADLAKRGGREVRGMLDRLLR